MTDLQRAVLFMATASALVAATTLLAKVLGQGPGPAAPLPPFMVSAGRFAFALIALSIFVALRPAYRPDFRGARYPLHLGRSICGWLGITAMFAAAARMPLAEATAIGFLNPLITVLLAIPLLGERATPRKAIAAVLAAAGALILLQPGSGAFQPAALLALAAAVFIAIEVIFIKMLSDTEPPLRILLINNAIGATISVSVAALVWVPPTAVQWLALAAIGVIMVTGQACFIQAMKRDAASGIAPVMYLTLVFAALYDLAVFGVAPTDIATLGAALIIAGAWMTTLRGPRERGR